MMCSMRLDDVARRRKVPFVAVCVFVCAANLALGRPAAQAALFISGLLGLIGCFVWQRRRENRAETRKRMGLCRHCGYDLRASPGRCPECGAAGGTAGITLRFSGGPRSGPSAATS